MGKLKNYYHEELCEGANEPGPDPTDLELLKADAELAWDRYQRALKDHREKFYESF